MNINKINEELRDKSFGEVLVDINNIIEHAAEITYPQYKDKILNNLEDIQQNIRIKLWLSFTSIPMQFKDMEEVRDYIIETAEEVLEETRS